MDISTHCARITAPIACQSGIGRKRNMLIDPCLVEGFGGRAISILPGARAMRSVASLNVKRHFCGEDPASAKRKIR